jgi:hypothetical protein
LGLKTRNKIVILDIVFGSVLSSYSAIVFFIPNAYAIKNTEMIRGLAATFESRGIAIFDDVATGKLPSLNNSG